MIIVLPTDKSPKFRYGGQLAWAWADCSSVRQAPLETYKELVVPWANKWFQDHYFDRHFETRLKAPFKYGHTIVIEDPSESYDVVRGSASLQSSSRGKAKDFKQAKKDDKIVLKPLFKYQIKSVATPNLYPGSDTLYGQERLRLTDMDEGIKAGGVCRGSALSHRSLECDVQSTQLGWDKRILRDVVTTPVSELDIESIQSDVVEFLSREEVKSSLVTTVVAEANSATFDIGTEIGEMPETIKMILDGVKGGIKLLLRAKREIKQNLSSGSIGKDAASLWMAYRYGLMPIVYSINDGLDLLEMENRKFQSFRGRADSPALKFNARGYTCVSAPEVEHRCFLKYGFDLESKIHQGLKINFLATAWELFPLSFVWDWFFQVGDYLTAMFRPAAVNQVGCTYSTRVKGDYVFENDTHSTITVSVDYYKVDLIKPDSFIGINSDVFVSFKRQMDALALVWLLFKKDAK